MSRFVLEFTVRLHRLAEMQDERRAKESDGTDKPGCGPVLQWLFGMLLLGFFALCLYCYNQPAVKY